MVRLRFDVDLAGVDRRLLALRLLVDELDAAPGPLGGDRDSVEFSMPVWTPGSYLVREYSRHLRSLRAEDGAGNPLACHKSAKNRWRVARPLDGRLILHWQIYARDLSVRTAYTNGEFAFWNGACTYLWPVGAEALPAEIAVRLPPGWSLAAGSLPVADETGPLARFSVQDQDEAVDQPCLAGRLATFELELDGCPHRFVEVGREGIPMPESFRGDVLAVLRASAAVFGGALPFERYTFLSLFAERGRGGLEHRDSSTLLAPRTTFAPRAAYEDYLALIAHEYLHAWNVKRMRPREFWSYDLERENHTSLLWVAEGFTAYLDDLLCLRAGSMTPRRYLGRLASHVDAMHANPGRFRQSLAEASFDAWLLLYRPDESTRNATQNYYTNGALAAFVIDAAIRRASAGQRCLDDALRELWRTTYVQGRGYDHADVCRAISVAAGEPLEALVDSLTLRSFEPDLDGALALFGLRLEFEDEAGLRLGVRLDAQRSTIASVQDGSLAERAGLAPGDEILALDRLRVQAENFDAIWSFRAVEGQPVRVLVAREGALRDFEVVPERGKRGGKARIVAAAVADQAQLAQRRAWLGASSLGGGTAD
ncbi:MAG: M61 family metallopeptidase [Planctomycetes bacterium]|nr:M61 family metallopeptidase [Planctomycetota bacterium]